MTSWNVITAGPHAGKTTTINELSGRGYQTIPESARLVIDKYVSRGVNPESVRRIDTFQSEIEETDRRNEAQLEKDRPCFLDRSLADNIAYRRFFEKEIPDGLVKEASGKYDNVFLLEQLPFEDDYARSEDRLEAVEIQRELKRTYEELGYDVIEVPVIQLGRRANRIEVEAGLFERKRALENSDTHAITDNARS